MDISPARNMLSHAYRGRYEIALLVAGDGDYVPVVDAVKRMGRMVEFSLG